MAKPLASSSANVFRPTEREKNSLGRFTYQLVYRPGADARPAAGSHSLRYRSGEQDETFFASGPGDHRTRPARKLGRAGRVSEIQSRDWRCAGTSPRNLVAGRIRVVSTT